MTSASNRWLYYLLAIAAILCSVVSLFALIAMNAPRWIGLLNIAAVILVLLAAKTRGKSIRAKDG